MSDSHGRGFHNISKKFIDSDSIEMKVAFKPGGNMKEVLRQTKDKTFDSVIIFGGTNGIPQNENILSELTSFFKMYESKEIFVMEIPFRYDKAYLNKKIEKVNDEIKQLVSRFDNGHMIYINDALVRSDYTPHHGLHMLYHAKRKIGSIISYVIQHCDSNALPAKSRTHQVNRVNNELVENKTYKKCKPIKQNFFSEKYKNNKTKRYSELNKNQRLESIRPTNTNRPNVSQTFLETIVIWNSRFKNHKPINLNKL